MAGELWIWGRRPVVEALRRGQALEILVASGRSNSGVLEEIRSLASERSVKLREVTLREIERVAGSTASQGVAALLRPASPVDFSSLLTVSSSAGNRFLLCLDQIQDPQNLGALLRTANAAGVQGVVMPDRHSAPLSGAAVKASAGAALYTPTVRVSNLVRALTDLRRAGIWLVGLAEDAGESLFELDLRIPLALVIGGEGGGLRRLTKEQCDFLARIPMQGEIGSLNAAVAGSIAMYEVVRQRQSPIGRSA